MTYELPEVDLKINYYELGGLIAILGVDGLKELENKFPNLWQKINDLMNSAYKDMNDLEEKYTGMIKAKKYKEEMKKVLQSKL